jgi:hypothetical protein
MINIKEEHEHARRKEFFENFKEEDIFFDTIRRLN